MHFLEWKYIDFSIKISLKFIPKCPINNISALVQIMARCRPGDKPLSEPMMIILLTHICVTRPQWIKCLCATLQWRHNERDGVSNDQPHDCLLNHLFRRRSKKTSKLCVTGLSEGNSPVTGEFPAQRASNAENVSIWWRHHVSGVPSRVVAAPALWSKRARKLALHDPGERWNHYWPNTTNAMTKNDNWLNKSVIIGSCFYETGHLAQNCSNSSALAMELQ